MNNSNPAYYLTLFKVDGHEKWRAMLNVSAKAFEDDCIKNMKGVKITEKQKFSIDRFSGIINSLTK